MTPALQLLPLLLLAPHVAGPAHHVAGSARRDDVWTQAELEAKAKEIQADVERMRGQKFLRPVKVELATQESFLGHATDRMDRFMSPGMLEGSDTMARMLGLIPPDMDLMEQTMELLRGQVGGFYSPGTDTFYLMENFTGAVAEIILAHELTHALDDQLFDLDAGFLELMDDSDRSLAYASVVEGSGTSLMNQWTMKRLLSGDLDADELGSMEDMGIAEMEAAPSFIWLPLLSAYLRGSSFLARSDSLIAGQMQSADADDLVRAFEHPPASSEQVLHPEKYWDDEHRDEPRRILFATDSLPAGCSVIHQDTLGEIYLSIFATPEPLRQKIDAEDQTSVMGIEYTNTASEGWGGDRMILIGKGDARFLRLVTRWDTERDAAEFFGALSLQEDALARGLKAVAKLDTGDESPRTKLTLEYGEPDEVIVTATFGLKRSELRRLLGALSHTEE